MEAGLPSWRGLIELLLETVATALPKLSSYDERKSWIDGTLQRDDLLGAGAVVEVMAQQGLELLVPEQLYGGQGPEAFAPGPIAHQVARLREIWVSGLRSSPLTTTTCSSKR
jgi:hypothetical protein